MTGPELDRLLVDSKLEHLSVSATLPGSVTTLEQLRVLLNAFEGKKSTRSRPKKVETKSLNGDGWLLPGGRSDFCLVYGLAASPKEKDEGETEVRVVLRFFRRPNSEPPKELSTRLEKGQSVEWLLGELSGLVEKGRKVGLQFASGIEMPRFQPPLLARVAEMSPAGSRFRCSGVEFRSFAEVSEGLVSFQISEDAFDGRAASVVFLTYRRVADGFGGLLAEDEQAVSFRFIREILNEQG